MAASNHRGMACRLHGAGASIKRDRPAVAPAHAHENTRTKRCKEKRNRCNPSLGVFSETWDLRSRESGIHGSMDVTFMRACASAPGTRAWTCHSWHNQTMCMASCREVVPEALRQPRSEPRSAAPLHPCTEHPCLKKTLYIATHMTYTFCKGPWGGHPKQLPSPITDSS